MLANESVDTTAEVELLVTDALYDDLSRDNWRRRTTDDGAFVSDTYLLDVTGLVADGWSRDDITLVSMVQVRPEAVQAVLRPAR